MLGRAIGLDGGEARGDVTKKDKVCALSRLRDRSGRCIAALDGEEGIGV